MRKDLFVGRLHNLHSLKVVLQQLHAGNIIDELANGGNETITTLSEHCIY
jgi:hypothetical protein